ncbi:hypothetical protein MUP05_06815 [Candidatus Bathyarchaeota archaeon]|nr:hypothetical protein [Candidatus Bathyarchaeota archaeon]
MVKVRGPAQTNIRKIEGAAKTFVTGKKSMKWALSQITDVPIRGRELQEIIKEIVNGLAEIVKDEPIRERGNDLLKKLKAEGLFA